MSRIYFHGQDGTEAELLGSERAYMGYTLCSQTTLGLLDAGHRVSQLKKFISPSHYMANLNDKSPNWGHTYETAFSSMLSEDGLIRYRNVELSPFTISLNTVLAIGNDPMRLAARLHGQCEIHAWIDAPDCGWVADIIGDGLALGVYRDDMGWESVADLLASSTTPVVTSYSVCDQFPSRHALLEEDNVGPEDDEGGDWWYDKSDDWRWDAGMRWLRAQKSGLQIKPENWDTFHFGDGITVFDLLAPDYGKRMSTKLGLIADTHPTEMRTGLVARPLLAYEEARRAAR